MIKINLLPSKKKKKAKPVPGFIVACVGVLLASVIIVAYLVFFFNSRLSARKVQVAENERKIDQLSKKIKAVENYEKLNSTYKKHKEIIEQLGKNKTLPVKVVNEVSAMLPAGVWLNTLDVKGQEISVSGTGFTNSDVVNYVNNLKKSEFFSDVYLQESVQNQTSGFSVYAFRLTYKVKT